MIVGLRESTSSTSIIFSTSALIFVHYTQDRQQKYVQNLYNVGKKNQTSKKIKLLLNDLIHMPAKTKQAINYFKKYLECESKNHQCYPLAGSYRMQLGVKI